MKYYLLISSLVASVFVAQAQEVSKKLKQVDAVLAFAEDQFAFSGHYTHQWKLGKSQKFSIGWGARLSVYTGSNQFYETAPAELTSESTSPLIFFSEIIPENMDSFLIASPQVVAMNLSIDMRYQFTSKLAAGFSIDALGFSLGGEKNGTHINGAPTRTENAKPTPFNILLISDNDRGSLNSEIYLAYDVSEKIAVKAGTQFLFTEYTTDTNVQTTPKENDRFRNKSLLIAVGVILKL
jgi:hypothetical protein